MDAFEEAKPVGNAPAKAASAQKPPLEKKSEPTFVVAGSSGAVDQDS